MGILQQAMKTKRPWGGCPSLQLIARKHALPTSSVLKMFVNLASSSLVMVMLVWEPPYKADSHRIVWSSAQIKRSVTECLLLLGQVQVKVGACQE
jgi:hypothetical protein